MSNIFNELILPMPALIIFPITLLLRAVAASRDAQPNSYHLMSSCNLPGNNNRFTDLNNYNKNNILLFKLRNSVQAWRIVDRITQLSNQKSL